MRWINMLITFPSKTAKQIVNECDNKLGNGKLMYLLDWYKDKKFFTKEKCRKRTIEITDEVEHLGKSWNECKELVGEKNMLNFPEMIWFIKTYFENTGKYHENWSWTSSLSSDGYLVSVGGADPDGVGVSGDYPGYSASRLGVLFSGSVATKGAKGGEPEAESLESRVERLENWVERVRDQLL